MINCVTLIHSSKTRPLVPGIRAFMRSDNQLTKQKSTRSAELELEQLNRHVSKGKQKESAKTEQSKRSKKRKYSDSQQVTWKGENRWKDRKFQYIWWRCNQHHNCKNSILSQMIVQIYGLQITTKGNEGKRTKQQIKYQLISQQEMDNVATK